MQHKVSPINTASVTTHYFYGYGSTHEEAVQDALALAKKRDPSAYVQDGRVYFTQIPAL